MVRVGVMWMVVALWPACTVGPGTVGFGDGDAPAGDAPGGDEDLAGPLTAIPTLDFPNGIAVTEDHVFVVIGEEHTNPGSVPVAAGTRSVVQVFAVTDGRWVKDIDVPAGGHAMRLTPDGSEIYVAHFSMDRVVSAISTSTLEVVVEIGGGPQMDILVVDSVAVSEDGAWVYVASNGQNTAHISRIATADHAVDTGWRIPVVGGYTCWVEGSPEPGVLYTNSWTGGTVQRKLIDTQSPDGTAAVGDYPHAVIIDPTGAFVYALVSGGNTVVKLEASTMTEISRLVGPYFGFWGGPVSGVWSKSKKTAFIVNYGVDSVAAIDLDPESGTYETSIGTFDVGAGPIFAALSPDGETLYVANNSGSTISVVDVSGYP